MIRLSTAARAARMGTTGLNGFAGAGCVLKIYKAPFGSDIAPDKVASALPGNSTLLLTVTGSGMNTTFGSGSAVFGKLIDSNPLNSFAGIFSARDGSGVNGDITFSGDTASPTDFKFFTLGKSGGALADIFMTGIVTHPGGGGDVIVLGSGYIPKTVADAVTELLPLMLVDGGV